MLGRWFGRLALTWVLVTGSTAARAQQRHVMGVLDGPGILQPLAAGRALVCGASCAVFSAGDGTWTPTSSAKFDLVSMATRLGDGSVLVLNNGNSVPPQLWNPSSGTWQEVVAPPSNLSAPQLVTSSEGRALLASLDARRGHAELRVYGPDASGWKLFTRIERDTDAVEMLVSRTTLTTLSHRAGKLEVERYDSALDRWQGIVKLDDPQAQLRSLGTLWGIPVLGKAGEVPPKASLLEESGKLTLLPTLQAQTSIRVREIPSATRVSFALVVLDGKPYLWRRLDQPLIALPAGSAEGRLVTLDENTLLLGYDSALWLIPLDGRPPPGQPCDGLERYLDMLGSTVSSYQPSLSPDGSPTVLGQPCREQVRQQRAPALLTRLRRAARGPASAARDLSRILECVLQDSEALAEIPTWFEAQSTATPRVACLQSLVNWPGAEAARTRIIGSSVYGPGGSRWTVDPELRLFLRTQPSSHQLLDELSPALRVAARQRAFGFDELYRGTCRELARASAARAAACADLSKETEKKWGAEPDSGNGGVATVIVASSLVVGAVITAHLTRESNPSRAIAAGSGVVGGFALGATLGGAMMLQTKGKSGAAGGVILGLGVLGAVAGGVGGYALARAPGARAPVTAGGLAFPYLVTLGFALE
jgi:hypothetical protein